MSFRQSLNKWGGIMFGGLFAVGIAMNAIEHFKSSSDDGEKQASDNSQPAVAMPDRERNALERALVLGVSDRASMDAFRNKGGLEFEHKWLGFRVYSMRTMHDPTTDKLAQVELKVFKAAMSETMLGSFDNISAALANTCGRKWTQNEFQREAGMHEATAMPGISCSIHSKDVFVDVTLSRRVEGS
jgi:hypothetical protein